MKPANSNMHLKAPNNLRPHLHVSVSQEISVCQTESAQLDLNVHDKLIPKPT
jgi:hypothetical protein